MAAETRPCQGPCHRNRSEKFFKSPRARICKICQRETRRKALRAYRLNNVYEMTQDEYDALYEAQEGKCAACGQERDYLLHVEHDHKIEREEGVKKSIRGLCCKSCNNLIRDARDNAQLLRSIADYLEDPPAQKILAALSR